MPSAMPRLLGTHGAGQRRAVRQEGEPCRLVGHFQAARQRGSAGAGGVGHQGGGGPEGPETQTAELAG